ncbi:uncharacterized protein PG998_001072 [Apiospora kogelbergensis]|uniref:Uncharacterized protein n=1 Tax=Apiospora kogelbergensis TaxID=1337665 RepID=A0AAW0QU16_9PEZI
MAAAMETEQFPCVLTIQVPFPTARLASVALQSLQVDKELSPLVRRIFTITPSGSDAGAGANATPDQHKTLQVEYRATTNRMLRVAVNSFMESLNLVIEVMEHLDADVLAAEAHSS